MNVERTGNMFWKNPPTWACIVAAAAMSLGLRFGYRQCIEIRKGTLN